MNRETFEKIIKISNWNDKLYTVIETKDNSYKYYGNVIIGIDLLSFNDDNDKLIVLHVEDVIGVKIAEV